MTKLIILGLFLSLRQCLKAGNDIEQFFVDPALSQTVKRPVQVFQQFVDVAFCALHRREAAGIFAGE